jgi:tetratricopeptide (TPR) repeat protein
MIPIEQRRVAMVRRIDAATWYLPASVGGFLMVCLMLAAATVRADESPGQAELDKAIDAKLGADDLDDYDRVLEHCKKAIELGLDAESKAFADDLHTGTLVDRAGMLVDAIYDAVPPNPQWPRMRAFALRDLGEVVERDPQLGQAHLMIARLESLPRGDRERARKAAEKALELLGDDRLQMAKAHIVLAGLEEDDTAKQEDHYA